MMRDYADRPQKAEARQWMFADIPRRTSILTLPSQQLGCVKHMRKHGVIGQHTRQQWVERNSRIVKLLQTRLDRLTTLHHIELEDYQPAPVDLANLDMECSFTERLGLWIEQELTPKLLPDSYLILTVLAHGRNNPFLERWLPRQVRHGFLVDELRPLQVSSGSLVDYDFLLPSVLLQAALWRLEVSRVRSATYQDQSGARMVCMCYHIAGLSDTATALPFSHIVQRYRQGPLVGRGDGEPLPQVDANLSNVLASMNFSVTAAGDGQYWLHNHDRGTTTMRRTFSIDELHEFFQVSKE